MNFDDMFETAAVAQLDLPSPVVVGANATVRETVERMRENRRSAVLVVEEDDLAGLFTDVDYVRSVVGRNVSADTAIADFMTADLTTVTRETKLSRALELMSRGNFRHLPVVDSQGQPIGLLGVGHLIQYFVEHYPAEILAMAPNVHQVVEAEGG